MGKHFFSTAEMDGQMAVRFSDAKAHHIINVLRMRLGDTVILCDGKGMDFTARLIDSNRSEVVFTLHDPIHSTTELPFSITLFQGIPKGDKFDWIIEKAVEIGVNRIVPVFTEHSSVKVKDAFKKRARYERVATAAAAQCMRGVLPIVDEAVGFDESLKRDLPEISLVAHEKESINTVKATLRHCTPTDIGVWVGPEGGFSTREIDLLSYRNIASVSLGSRILRCETAGLVALSQIIYEWYL